MYLLQMPDDETILIVNNHMESYSLAASEKDKFREYLKDFSPRKSTRSDFGGQASSRSDAQ